MWKQLLVVGILVSMFVCTTAQTRRQNKSASTLPPGYWPLEQSQPVIDKTQTIHLAPDISNLTAGEKQAVTKLLAAGQIFQRLYEQQRHAQALNAYRDLLQLTGQNSSPALQNLLTLYRLNQGPIATT